MSMKITFVNVMGKMSTVFSIPKYPVRCKCFYRWQNDKSQYFERILNAFEHEIILSKKDFDIQTECNP